MPEFKEAKKSFPWLIVGVVSLLVLNLLFLGYFYFSRDQKIIPAPVLTQEKNLKIIFLDVGHGDAILIKTPEGKNTLIDGGPDKNIIYKLDQYIHFYQRKIDLMILTHPHPDHLNGLVEVLKRYPVGQVFYNGVIESHPSYLEFLKEIEEKKIKKEVVWLGKFTEIDGSKIEIIFPFEDLSGQNFKNDNEASIVLKLTFDKIKVLFTGDATKKVEKKLIENNLDLKAEILKVAHHGAKDATSFEFLEKVKPIYAVISVGKNRFGHPSLRVLRNLEKIGAKVLRTDKIGDIIFEINGEKIEIKTKN